jgi:hypothetical protein
MTAEDVVARARKAIGHGCAYMLGRGGMRGEAEWPWDDEKGCDCSGFTAWCLRLSRHTQDPWYRKRNGGWLETSAIAADTTQPLGLFSGIPWIDAHPGDLVVYGDRPSQQGHIGVVSEVDSAGPLRAVHCSSGNYRRHQDAIQETGVEAWALHGDSVVARYDALTEPVA